MLGAQHPQLAVRLYKLGGLQQQRGDLASAEQAFARALVIDTAAYGPAHLEVATDLEALAEVQKHRGNVSGAEGNRLMAATIMSQQPSPD